MNFENKASKQASIRLESCTMPAYIWKCVPKFVARLFDEAIAFPGHFISCMFS